MNLKRAALAPFRGALSTIYREGGVYTIPLGPNRGMKMRYFPQLQYHMILGLHEMKVFQSLWKAIVASGKLGKSESGRCYFDVGSNVGLYAMWFSRLIPHGKVVCVEAGPEAFLHLRDNLSLNDTKNVITVAAACSDKKGTATFYLGESSHEQSSLYKDIAAPTSAAKAISVATISIDGYLKEHPEIKQVDCIRMDIEGGATLALPGAFKTIEKHRPLLCVESHSVEEDATVGKILRDYNYTAYSIGKSRWVQDSTKTFPDPTGVWGVLICVPNEHVPSVRKVLG